MGAPLDMIRAFDRPSGEVIGVEELALLCGLAAYVAAQRE